MASVSRRPQQRALVMWVKEANNLKRKERKTFPGITGRVVVCPLLFCISVSGLCVCMFLQITCFFLHSPKRSGWLKNMNCPAGNEQCDRLKALFAHIQASHLLSTWTEYSLFVHFLTFCSPVNFKFAHVQQLADRHEKDFNSLKLQTKIIRPNSVSRKNIAYLICYY